MSVTIYTKPGCPYCAGALEDLDARGVDYEQKDVKSSAAIEKEALQWSGGQRRVPIIVSDGKAEIGFNGA